MMIFRKKERDDILNNEPYAAFIKKFDKLQSVINEKIHIRIDTNSNGNKTGFTSGFYLDSCYAQWFELKFEFYGLDNEESNPNKQLYVMHSLEYKFVDDDGYSGGGEQTMNRARDILENTWFLKKKK